MGMEPSVLKWGWSGFVWTCSLTLGLRGELVFHHFSASQRYLGRKIPDASVCQLPRCRSTQRLYRSQASWLLEGDLHVSSNKSGFPWYLRLWVYSREQKQPPSKSLLASWHFSPCNQWSPLGCWAIPGPSFEVLPRQKPRAHLLQSALL